LYAVQRCGWLLASDEANVNVGVQPAFLSSHGPTQFPDPRLSDDEGLVAIGGDLSPQSLLAAYDAGIFPWYSEDYPPLWWCPNPRAIIPLDDLHLSRSMARVLRRGGFRVTWNQAFSQVLRECGAGRSEGTWILPDMVHAYERLHRAGHAFSIEVWVEASLVGGLYGVQRGGLFAAESMFHRQTDMSKVALLFSAASLNRAGIRLFDVQFLTPHLASLGAKEIDRGDYLARVKAERGRSVDLTHLTLVSPLG
jgi:leucyl/phenylalanyl-tRNA---protein transferase